jgi:hypothetical protein
MYLLVIGLIVVGLLRLLSSLRRSSSSNLNRPKQLKPARPVFNRSQPARPVFNQLKPAVVNPPKPPLIRPTVINPTTGLPMAGGIRGGIDVGGTPYMGRRR